MRREMNYPFTQAEFNAAAKAWGCNCGPSALAFSCQCSLETAHLAIPHFDKRRYTSPSMMEDALDWLRIAFVPEPTRHLRGQDASSHVRAMFDETPALVRVQWGGPWYGRYAYRHTHWISCCPVQDGRRFVFDCNGGISECARWLQEIVPLLIPKRGDGTWFPTHIWRMFVARTPRRAGAT